MTLDEFRNLEPTERVTWVANTIMCQHARLRRGDSMEGPVDVFLNGRRSRGGEDVAYDESFMPVGPTPVTVTAGTIMMTPGQVLDGHPFIKMDAGDFNYLHMYTVEVMSDFNGKNVGDLISVKHGNRSFKIPLTQQMVDDTAYILVRFALSR